MDVRPCYDPARRCDCRVVFDRDTATGKAIDTGACPRAARVVSTDGFALCRPCGRRIARKLRSDAAREHVALTEMRVTRTVPIARAKVLRASIATAEQIWHVLRST